MFSSASMRVLLPGLLLLALAGAAQAGHGIAIINQTGAGACLGDGFAGEGHAYRGNFTNISQVFLFNITTTAGWNSSNVTAGDEIRVCGGLYDERVIVNKTNVTLRANNTSFDVTVNASLGTNDSIGIESNDVSVAWFVLQNATGTGNAGVKAANFSNVSNNRLVGNYFGINISVNGNNTIANNTVLNNSRYGIYVSASSNNSLFRNNATGNGDGIYMDSSSGNNLSENTVAGNNRSGINISSSANNTIQSNNASANGQSGISLLSSGGSSISNNTVSWNLNEGIRLRGVNNTTVNATNRIFNNSWNGIRIESGSANNNVSFNQIWSNTVSNINISQSNATAISGNIINNSTAGILFSDSRDHVLRNNTLRNHTIHLNASATTNTTVNDSTFDTSFDTAILLSASILRVANTTLTASTSLDLNLTGGSAATLLNVTYAPSKVNVSDTSTITRKWFLDVRVLTTEGNPIPGALVNASNATGASAFAGLATSSIGNITTQEVTEFVNRSNGSAMVNDTHTPYNLTANKTGYANNTSLIGVTGNNWTVLLLGNDQVAPVVTLNYPNATNVTYISRWTNPNLEVSINYTEFSPANVTVNVTNATFGEANGTRCFATQANGNCTADGGNALLSGENRTLLVRFAPLNNTATEGYYNLSIVMLDNSSNNGTASNTTANFSVVVDHTGPEVDRILVNNTTRVNVTSGISVWVNFTYNETFPANYTINITNATTRVGFLDNSSPNSTGSAFSTENRSVAVFSNASDGLYNVSVQVCDKALNCTNFTNGSHWLNGSVAVDNVAPGTDNETPSASGFTNDNTPEIRVNVTDNGTGVNRSSLRLRVKYGAVDCIAAENALESIGAGCAALANSNIAVTPLSNGFFVQATVVAAIADGTTVQVTANASDYFPRAMTPFSWSFTVDTTILRFTGETPRSINLNATAGPNFDSRQTGFNRTPISVNITDDLSGINRTTVRLRVNHTPTTTNYTVTCDEAFRNNTTCEAPNATTIRIRHVPTTPFANLSLVNITVNASDNAGTAGGFEFNFTVNQDVPFWTNETPQNGTFIRSFTNRTRPTLLVEVFDLGNGGAGNIAGASPASLVLRVNSTQVCSGAQCQPTEFCGPSRCLINFTPTWDFASGESVRVSANLTDGAGLVMNPGLEWEWNFTVDTTAPTASSNSPTGWNNSSNPAVQVNLNDTISGINVSTVNMTVNVTNSTGTWVAKVASNNSSTGPNVTVSYGKLTGLASGTNVTVNVTVSDNASNPMASDFNWTFQVDLDNAAGKPAIAVSKPTNGTTTGNNSNRPNGTYLAFTPSDNLASTLSCFRVLDGTDVQLLGGNLANNSAVNNTTSLAGLSNGSHNASLFCDDQAGNRNQTGTVNWTVDAVAPVLSGGSCGTPTSSSITFSMSVDQSGECRFSTSEANFDAMGSLSTGVGSWTYSTTASSLSAGTSYTIHAKCWDYYGNEGHSDLSCTTASSGGGTTGGQTGGQTGGGSTPPPSCSELWTCTDWPPCSSGGTQTRTCTDARACGTTGSKPPETATCIPTTATPTPATVVTALPPPPAPAAGAPGAGSSTATTAAPETKAIPLLSKGATREVKFSNLGIELEGFKELKNVEVTYAPLDKRPAGVPFPGGDAYRYFQAEAKGLSQGDAKVTFTFSVERSWLTQAKASEGAIRLLRLPSGAKDWQTLQTQPGKGDSTKVEFTARSDGFSVFAIAATGSAPTGGFPLWVVPVAIGLLAVVVVSRSQRMAPFWWRMRVRFRR